MIHYHCADINPHHRLTELAGRHLLVSHAYPAPAAISHQIGQSVLLDNGAYSVWKSNRVAHWENYYPWCDHYLNCPTTWAIIPDVIDGSVEDQDRLIKEWPFGQKGAPVWHLNEPIDRLLSLTNDWSKVCLGSAGEFATIATNRWHLRMQKAFNALAKSHQRMPWTHGLRMQCVGHLFPFASVDSSDIARHQSRPQNTILGMAERWDRAQPNFKWTIKPEQGELL